MNSRLAEVHERRVKANHGSDVVEWHRLSGLPDNVTDEGEVVRVNEGKRQRVDKEMLHSAIESMKRSDAPASDKSLARLAKHYLDVGDVEAARHYTVENGHSPHNGVVVKDG
jgi:hypothetical protein